MIWLAKLGKYAPLILSAIDLARSWAAVAIERYRAKKAEEERKKVEAETLRTERAHVVHSKENQPR